jgi:cobalt/nickel transport system permease protein
VPNLFTAQTAFNRLEDLAEGGSPIHVLHPSVKIITTLFYIILVISFDRYNISGLSGFALYPAVVIALSKIPLKPLFLRFLIALPFGLFGGIANIFYDTETAFTIAGASVSYGALSCLSILIKTFFTVMAALILIASTKITDIADQLLRFRFPPIFVLSFMMIYRYISVFTAEVGTTFNAYTLRAGGNGVAIKDMGFFCGNLFLKSYDRADRIYSAMKCRGFDGRIRPTRSKIDCTSMLFMLITVCSLAALRVIDLGGILGKFFIYIWRIGLT